MVTDFSKLKPYLLSLHFLAPPVIISFCPFILSKSSFENIVYKARKKFLKFLQELFNSSWEIKHADGWTDWIFSRGMALSPITLKH